MRITHGVEFQTDSADSRKACLEKSFLLIVSASSKMTDKRRGQPQARSVIDGDGNPE